MSFLTYFTLFNHALDLADRIETRLARRNKRRFRKYGVWQSFDRVLYEEEQKLKEAQGIRRQA